MSLEEKIVKEEVLKLRPHHLNTAYSYKIFMGLNPQDWEKLDFAYENDKNILKHMASIFDKFLQGHYKKIKIVGGLDDACVKCSMQKFCEGKFKDYVEDIDKKVAKLLRIEIGRTYGLKIINKKVKNSLLGIANYEGSMRLLSPHTRDLVIKDMLEDILKSFKEKT